MGKVPKSLFRAISLNTKPQRSPSTQRETNEGGCIGSILGELCTANVHFSRTLRRLFNRSKQRKQRISCQTTNLRPCLSLCYLCFLLFSILVMAPARCALRGSKKCLCAFSCFSWPFGCGYAALCPLWLCKKVICSRARFDLLRAAQALDTEVAKHLFGN
jgi:hypothetical protein